MDDPPLAELAATDSLTTRQVLAMAVFSLAVGLGIGYLCRGFQVSSPQPSSAARNSSPQVPPGPQRVPTLEDMRKIADQQAAPLLARLKTSPRDSALLSQVAAIYHGHHQFKEAAGYYEKAVQAEPKDVALRTRLASSLCRAGDVDGALAQLNQGLQYDPRDANSLFNLGMIRLQGKGDAQGALAAWQKLLKSNPQLRPERKAEVQKLMADVMTTVGNQEQAKGARSR